MQQYKVGIITYPRIEDGKGRFLQAYALYSAIKELRYSPEVMNYYPEEWRKKRTLIDKVFQFVKSPNIWGYIKTIKQRASNKKNKMSIDQSYEKYIEFISHNMIYDYTKIQNKEELYSKNFDAWICGSDQIWNPHFSVGVDEVYYLQFAPKNKRISYAASMGTLDVNGNFINRQKEWIEEIPFVSVREEGTKEMLEKKCGIFVEHVCDPTFLMERTWWDKLGGKRIVEVPYLLLFLFDTNPLPRKVAEQIASNRKLKIVCLSDDYQDSKKYEIPQGIGPEEFVSLFKYADFVCTQSFHGTVLSVIFNRQFLVFDRSGKGEVSGLILRIKDLLKQLNLEKRIVANGERVEDVPALDFRETNERLAEMRAKGYNFLRNSLEKSV